MKIAYTNDLKIRKGFIGAICIAFIFIFLLVLPAFLGAPTPNKVALTKMQINNLTTSLLQYYRDYGRLPVGTNREIIICLLGKDSIQNPKNINYLNFLESKIKRNDNGELLDAWGTPLKIELDPRDYKIFIKSFGANKNDDNGKCDDIVFICPPSVDNQEVSKGKSSERNPQVKAEDNGK